jgi:hypothetical protein
MSMLTAKAAKRHFVTRLVIAEGNDNAEVVAVDTTHPAQRLLGPGE